MSPILRVLTFILIHPHIYIQVSYRYLPLYYTNKFIKPIENIISLRDKLVSRDAQKCLKFYKNVSTKKVCLQEDISVSRVTKNISRKIEEYSHMLLKFFPRYCCMGIFLHIILSNEKNCYLDRNKCIENENFYFSPLYIE
jgi:hypothetical protein